MQKLLEKDLERTCTDYLKLAGWRAFKTDPVSRREWGKGFGEKGMADCLYIRYHTDDRAWNQHPDRYESTRILARARAQVMWIEWKRKGGKASQHQRDWHTLEQKYGALTLIAGEDFTPTFEGFKEFYTKSSLARKVL